MTRASGQQAAAEETVRRLWLALGHSSPPDLVPWEMQQLREVEAKRMSPSDMDLGLEELKRQTQMLETLVEQEVREGRIETRVETPLSRRPP